jgi:hypothetical protein
MVAMQDRDEGKGASTRSAEHQPSRGHAANRRQAPLIVMTAERQFGHHDQRMGTAGEASREAAATGCR